MNGDPTKFREPSREILKKWQGEPDLSGLRDRAELDKLPADERADCLALWDEARALLDRVEQVK